MIGVHLWIVDREESVPLEGVWDRVGLRHQASVREVGVLDVLGQPVLDELGHLLSDGNLSTFHSVHQTQVPQPVVGDVVLVVLDRGEESLLGPEVLVVEVLQTVPELLVVAVRLHIPHDVKEADVLIVHLLNTNSKARVPNIRVRNHVVSSQMELSTVGKVGVLDVLRKPVLGLVGHLGGEGKVGGLELGLEVVVLEVVPVAVVALDLAELALLVVEVHSQLGLAEGVLLGIGGVLSTLPDAVKEDLCKYNI